MAQIDNTTSQLKQQFLAHNGWTIGAVACFICACCSGLLYSVLPIWTVIGICVVFLIGCGICTIKIKPTSKVERFKIMMHPEKIDVSKLAENTGGNEVEVYDRLGNIATQNTDDCFLMSVGVNREFVTRPIWAEIDEEKYSFSDDILPYVDYLKDDRDAALSKFAALRPDKAVVGLASDIDLDLFGEDKPTVTVRNVTRYAVQVTDDAFDKMIINRKKVHNRVVFDGHRRSVDDNGSLIPLSKSNNANAIDIQSLIVSNDGYIMFARGTQEHPLHPGKVIASAACSLLPTELQDRPLQESMIDSIHNKIHVLYDIPESTNMVSSFCGFARMMEEGGSPEFYCLTLIDMPKIELMRAHKDPTSKFVDEMLDQSVPELKSVDDAAKYLAGAVDKLRESTKDEISMSASAMLSAIKFAMEDDAMSRKILRRIEVNETE